MFNINKIINKKYKIYFSIQQSNFTIVKVFLTIV